MSIHRSSRLPRRRRSSEIADLGPRWRRKLFGPETVQSLDDAEHHHHRKAMFLDVLDPDAVAALGGRASREWESAIRR